MRALRYLWLRWLCAHAALLLGAGPAALIALMSVWPVYYADRDRPAEREAAIETVAHAIAAATQSVRSRAAILTIARFESGGALYVYHGCEGGPPGACDGGLARGVFQQHRAACPQAYEHEAGSPESLYAEARCALSLLTRAYRVCRGRNPGGDVAGMFAGYRAMNQCAWVGREHDGSAARARYYHATVAKLQALERQQAQQQ